MSRFVCATRSENRGIAHLTSYRSQRTSSDMLNSVKIWEAGRATSAASTFFDSIRIGPNDEEFVDGATGSNNPVREVYTAAKDLWPARDFDARIKCLVSIGTGQPSLDAFGDNIIDIAKTLKEITMDTEYTAEVFRREHRELAIENRYFRFNVEKGLEKIGLEDSKRRNAIVAATRRYYESQAVLEQMQACRETLWTRECISIYA